MTNATKELRRKAQNEATCLALNEMCRLKDNEIESLRQQLAKYRDADLMFQHKLGFVLELQEKLAASQAREAKLREALIKCSEQLTRLGYSANHADEMIVNALRLAVQFDIVPRCINGVAFAWKDGLCDIQVPYTTDPYTAICKAIVQAACMAIEKENGK